MTKRTVSRRHGADLPHAIVRESSGWQAESEPGSSNRDVLLARFPLTEAQIAQLAGVTQRQLDSWVMQGLLAPSERDTARYSSRAAVRAILLRRGSTPEVRSIHHQTTHGQHPQAPLSMGGHTFDLEDSDEWEQCMAIQEFLEAALRMLLLDLLDEEGNLPSLDPTAQ